MGYPYESVGDAEDDTEFERRMLKLELQEERLKK